MNVFRWLDSNKASRVVLAYGGRIRSIMQPRQLSGEGQAGIPHLKKQAAASARTASGVAMQGRKHENAGL